MPDDTEKLISLSDSSSPDTREMGLNGGLWDSSNSSKNPPQLSSSEFDYGHESAASSPSGSVATNSDVKIELNGIDTTESAATSSWMVGQFGSVSGSRVPFTKREKEFLCCLIQKHVYLKIGQAQSNLPTLGGAFNQKNALSTFCRVPNAAWKAIANEYNSKDNVRQRSIKQLRKCWENLKHRGNIDPAALYSGKKLQGKTSLSGAFTLTADPADNGGIPIPPPKVCEGFIETSMEDDDVTGIENATTLSSPSRDVLPTDLSIRSKISPESSSLVVDNGRFQSSYESSSNRHIANGETISQPSNQSSALLLSTTSPPIITSRATFTVARTDDPVIANMRTVKSLKPSWSQPLSRKLGRDILKDRSSHTRPFANYSMITKTNTQKIQEMKLKLLAARLKEHEVNIQRVRMQMDQAQAQHDVSMRMLRTKAAWYDAHLRKLEKQLSSGDVGFIGEDEDDYHGSNPDDINIQYEQNFEEYS